MKKIALVSSLTLISLLSGAEPSVYGAGDIDSASPYGLTKTEKSVLENRKVLQGLRNRVKEQQNRIDGLTTIVNGLNKEMVELKEQMALNESRSGQETRDYNRTYSLLLELGKMVDTINNNYVTREDLNDAIGSGNMAQQRSILSSLETDSSEDISTVYRKGVQLFGKRSYNSARDHFLKTVARNYKPAASNYYLGEIAYYTKDYHSAIEYYKTSASLYDSASYMKTLYLHTAISLARTGEKEQAREFFQFVIDNYPNTKASRIARKNI